MQTTQFNDLKRWLPRIASGVFTLVLITQNAFGQAGKIDLNDLSAFEDPGKTWSVVARVSADLEEVNGFEITRGKGVLVNQPTERRHGEDLYTKLEHGDIDLELDYMMATGSNSGIYLQGMYEIQLLDSWGKKYPSSADNGGIYERWDENRPEGEKGYQGFPPRQNVSKAPGLWQHLKISFQAPRFDAQGNKTENARILLVELNGVTIHEDVELQGPTRGAMAQKEVAKGPLRIQGDHGAVAFKNIKYTTYESEYPSLSDLNFSLYEGEFEEKPNFDAVEPTLEGESAALTSNLPFDSDQVLIRYQGNLNADKAGDYTFNLLMSGGMGSLSIGGEEVISEARNNGSATVNLKAGSTPFELTYYKYVSWMDPSLGLTVSGSALRETIISDEDDFQRSNAANPILKEAEVNTTLRSFMRLPDNEIVVHAISVGSPEQIHYTYDLDHGTIVQVWRGRFLDATPMWNSRGNGTSRPLGSVQYLSEPEMTVSTMSSANASWNNDTTQYRPKGYIMDQDNRPTFRYLMNGVMVNDEIRATEGGKGIRRELSIEKPSDNLYVRLAEGNSILAMENGMYAVDDKAYYLKLEGDGNTKPTVREVNGKQQLIMPLRDKLTYSILF
ncbi:hypothetical protein OKW21_000960 [Catalinimonas alkaloidigena]|uniref:3-keto-disaccharide hydrolase n=1 Tax=Catalinimonas alkaloidigena TaxID=1075417 RepID=UPI002404FEB5|nr:DUF1080 domain-containing protein [Catalinimonas alkaloidigena]MDF9795697.1 hypothetical protein [Catalinimonas alkaloidigena]